MMSPKKMLVCLWLCFLGVSYVAAERRMAVYDDPRWLPSIGMLCVYKFLLSSIWR